MSAIIIMRIEVKRGKIKEFLDAISWQHITITDIHDYPRHYEFFTQPEQIGYAEPIILYDKVKEYVSDIWYNCVGDADLKPGSDGDITGYNYKWQSCKKEYKEEEN